MKLYVASHCRETAAGLKKELERDGHEVVSRWIVSDTKFGLGAVAYSDAERTALALQDEEDVRAACDGLVLIAEPEGRFVPGGKHVETGIALALRRPVFVVGRRENLFHWHPLVLMVPDTAGLLAALAAHRRVASPSPKPG